jgi:hypothetical protein
MYIYGPVQEFFLGEKKRAQSGHILRGKKVVEFAIFRS